uniref:SHC (Src homology 2 domain containing) transforming protein 2 n=1 Tax=Tetraodon nigroviridis TaxID=99883 RepID=H3DDC9_TETNG
LRAAPPGMLLKPKYDRFRNESVTSSDDLMQSLAMSSKVVATPVVPSSAPSLPLPPLDDATTTFCMLIPKMPQWKFSNSLLSRSPSNSSSGSSSSKDSGKAAAAPSQAPVAPTSSPQRNSTMSSAGGPVTRVEGMWLAGEDFTQKGSFIHKPSQGWLHPDKKIAGPGASYIVRYMGCIEVLKSMRSLDFNTRTQVTREAINRLCEAVPGGRGAWRKKSMNKALQTVMGKSNLRFAGMSIAVNISIDGLSLLIPTTRQQVIAHHPMQSISFASGGDTDTPDYVAYVAKDPVNQRACHILECSDGLAQSVISTIGQAFELQFKQYLHSPPKSMASVERSARAEEPIWGEDEGFSDHDYYNSIPGKEPPIGGVVDSRLRGSGAPLGHVHSQPLGCTAAQVTLQTDDVNGMGSPARRDQASYPPDGQSAGSKDYEEHQYVNTQNLENLTSLGAEGPRGGRAPDSPKRDIFDMRPFEDALKLHPPRRRAPVAPNEEQLRRETWYHSRMSRRDAERLLIRDGDFLVRESTTNLGQYVLTGMHCGLPKHLLLVDPEGVVRTKDMLFDSISHLIAYHLKNELPIVAAESELHLKQAVRRKQ